MNHRGVLPPGSVLPGQMVYVEPAVVPASPPFQPQQSRYALDSTPRGILHGQQYDHPIFKDWREVIRGGDKSEPWMRRNALELLHLHGIGEIARSKPGTEFVVVARMHYSLIEILKVELRERGSVKAEGECLLKIRKDPFEIQFLDVDAEGLLPDQVAWFKSLKGKSILRAVFTGEVHRQHDQNEKVFRRFYQGIGGADPASFTRLHAWFTLDRGRIEYVDGFGAFPRQRTSGLPTDFSATIVEGAAHVSCTNRSVLFGMPSVYLAYFNQPFITIRDAISAVIEGVPGEEGGVLDSDAVLA